MFMKKIMKFLSAGVLAGVLCASFAACNDKNAGNQNDGTRSSEGQSGETDPAPEITLTDAYYWGGDEKIPLERIEGKFMVMFYSENETQFMDELAKAGAEVSCVESGSKPDAAARGGAYKRATVEGDFEKIEDALALTFYWDHYYRQEDGRDAWTDGKFAVGLKSEADYPVLEKMAEENGVEIARIRKNEFRTTCYLACTNDSKGNAVEMGNLFHESGLFEWACPSLAGIFQLY
jgi:hypothetical protein